MYNNKHLMHISKSNKETISIVRKCLINSIGIEILNSNELFFFIYDVIHFDKLQSILGSKVINENNFSC